MGVDPVGFDEANPLTFNRYAYANNNPYKFVDPDGEAAVVAVISAATAFIIGNNAVNAYNNNASVFDAGLSANGLKAAGKSFTVDATVAGITFAGGGVLGYTVKHPDRVADVLGVVITALNTMYGNEPIMNQNEIPADSPLNPKTQLEQAKPIKERKPKAGIYAGKGGKVPSIIAAALTAIVETVSSQQNEAQE